MTEQKQAGHSSVVQHQGGGNLQQKSAPLVKFAKAQEDWKCLLIMYNEEGMEEEIPVVPVWKWLI